MAIDEVNISLDDLAKVLANTSLLKMYRLLIHAYTPPTINIMWLTYIVRAKSIARTYWQNNEAQKSIVAIVVSTLITMLFPLWKEILTNSKKAIVEILSSI
jgi:hypothetical protein